MEEIEDKLKNKLTKLGLYLIDKAESDIKEFERKNVLMKSNLKKRKNDRIEQMLNKNKNRLINQYNSKINNSTVSILLQIKNQLLDLKNALINQIKKDLIVEIEKKISKNYSSYIKYIVNSIKEKTERVKDRENIIFLFNKRDYKHFNEHKNLLKDFDKIHYKIEAHKENFMGGFLIMVPEDSLLFDYTFKNQINQKDNFIETIFSTFFSPLEEKYFDIEDIFEKDVNFLRNLVNEYLKNLEAL